MIASGFLLTKAVIAGSGLPIAMTLDTGYSRWTERLWGLIGILTSYTTGVFLMGSTFYIVATTPSAFALTTCS
jgi:hypothetical protein